MTRDARSIKKRACRYLLQHYLGHFLQERLSLDQLGLDLYNGSGVIREIHLDVCAVNELLETLGAPLEIVDGFVSTITVTIPWQALLTDHCTLEVSGLQITCRPKYRTSGGWDSQGWSSSMASSMQLAQECLKDPPEASEEPPAQLEGLEMFAQTIETVLRRIKVTFIDTIVRIEHQPLDLETGVALEVHIKRSTHSPFCHFAIQVSFQHESYPVAVAGPYGEGPVAAGFGPGCEQLLSRQVFIVQELEVRDRLASSQLNKFLYLYTSESMPRRAHSNMLTVKALQVCPESGLGGPECCLRVSLLPLRLNIDQDALFFLKDYFSNLASFVNPYLPVDPATEVKADPSQKASEEAESAAGLGPDLAASVETTYSEQSSSSAGSTSSADQPIYFREFRFTSEVPIWLDYQGKHVVIEQGTFAGILIGLAQLNCSELKLKRLCCRHGLLGVDKVIQYAVTEWLTDIRKNQLPGILGGVGPMHSVVQLFHGVRDLFWLPIEQYRKDGRIIRGLQRGAASFGTSTASAALELSNRLVQAIQATAETVYDILSPTPPLNRFAITEGWAPSSRPRRAAQPADLREGVAKAYDTVREGVIDTAQTLCDVASRGHEQKGLPGAVGGVLRQIPPTVVRPLIVASEATSNLLGGMRNQIKPDARKEDFLKWRTEGGQD
ncbi:autophagy-related protein 2 homolog A [Anarrhichthys ocellatus]|uniref:autophagy-related protein 2 homolog A n=1 Tax=Anarrhichthys ocellatus TaxID=433405 RepID=UPI0012EE5660|nr:autophagy-related protein 2 homolog A-like [Anarrhichthys ocellatus]